MDPHWFRGRIWVQLLSQCGSRSGTENQPNADPWGSGSWSDSEVTKSWIFFTMMNILKIVTGIKSKDIRTYEGTKAFLKDRSQVFIVNFGWFPCSLIRIRIPNTDPGSKSRTSQTSADPCGCESGSGSIITLVLPETSGAEAGLQPSQPPRSSSAQPRH